LERSFGGENKYRVSKESLSTMRYKLLGNSGLRVSELALGTMTFGDENGHGVADEKVSRELFDAFLEAGGNFIDTANDYTGGKSEAHLGKFISSSTERDRLVIATKYSANMRPDDPNSGGNSRKSMVHSVEASLKRLRSEYIDLLWVHMWDSVTPIEEVMRGLDALIRAGKILYVGVSDHPAWVVAQANTLAALKHWTPFVALQIEYSLIQRTPERELLPMAKGFGLTITPWSVLGAGLLTGRFNTSLKQNIERSGQLNELAERRNEKIWTANDDMGMGAIQALKEAGLAGKVLVTGADGIPEMFDAIKAGLAAATILNDGKYQFQLGLAMALAAKQGKLDVKSLPQKYRQFEIPAVNVNRENVNQVVHDYIESTPKYDLSGFFAQWSVAIP
jgi:aryl-alcohol dehydrogenase-like predicted oxidoreductase